MSLFIKRLLAYFMSAAERPTTIVWVDYPLALAMVDPARWRDFIEATFLSKVERETAAR